MAPGFQSTTPDGQEACSYDIERKTYTHNMFVFGIGITSIIGIVLNVLNARVFTKMSTGKSLVLYLLRVLAYSDLSLLVVSFILFPFRHIVARIVDSDEFFRNGDFQVMPYIYYPFVTPYFICVQVRNHMMVFVALER